MIVKLLLLAAILFLAYRVAVRLMAPSKPKAMPRAEAARLLGVADDADRETVLEAHRRLIGRNHPDMGGSHDLAAQINRARDVMLKP